MAKSRFLKPGKQVKKDIGKNFLNSAVSGGGFLVAKGAGNLIAAKITNPKMATVIGPAKFLLGTILEAFSAQPQMAAFGRGIAVSGMDTSASDFLPDTLKAKVGLSGTGLGASDTAVDGGKGFDWEAAMEKANAEIEAENNPVNGLGEENIDVDSAEESIANAMYN